MSFYANRRGQMLFSTDGSRSCAVNWAGIGPIGRGADDHGEEQRSLLGGVRDLAGDEQRCGAGTSRPALSRAAESWHFTVQPFGPGTDFQSRPAGGTVSGARQTLMSPPRPLRL